MIYDTRVVCRDKSGGEMKRTSDGVRSSKGEDDRNEGIIIMNYKVRPVVLVLVSINLNYYLIILLFNY